MNEQLQTMLDQLKERIEYFGFTYDPCDTLEYNVNGEDRLYKFVTFYHPEKLLLSGGFGILITKDKVECSLSPVNIQGDFQHCYDALWLGLKLWKVYGIDNKASSALGGEGE